MGASDLAGVDFGGDYFFATASGFNTVAYLARAFGFSGEDCREPDISVFFFDTELLLSISELANGPIGTFDKSNSLSAKIVKILKDLLWKFAYVVDGFRPFFFGCSSEGSNLAVKCRWIASLFLALRIGRLLADSCLANPIFDCPVEPPPLGVGFYFESAGDSASMMEC